MANNTRGINEARALRPLPAFIFASRWLQLPLYLGLIVAQAIYVWLFWQELYYLLMATFGDGAALTHILDSVSVEGAKRPSKPNETVLMLVVLGLIDVVMISNLLIMVIVGGYETFISRMGLEAHPDQRRQRLAAAHRGTEQVDQLDPEVIDVDALGEDQSQVERQLQPAGQEYEVGQWPESSGRRGGRRSHRLFRLRGSKL